MISFNLGRWLKTWWRSRGRTITRKPTRSRLFLEELETRLAPSINWVGPSGGNWSNASNWSAPLVAGSDLLFPAISSAMTVHDDVSISINSISIASGSTAGYTFDTTGGAILTLGSSASPFITDQSGAADSMNMNITINGPANSTQTLAVSSGTTLTFGGSVGQMTGTSQLTAQGGGTIIINQANTFTGSFTINNDATIIQMQNGSAFGNNANPVTLGNNSEIILNPSSAITVPYNITVTGYGTGGSSGTTSPILNSAGNNTWTGDITFNTNATSNMYFVVSGSTTFTINGVIHDSGATGNLIKWDTGELILNNANQYHGYTEIKNGVVTVEDPLALGPSSAQQVFTRQDPITGSGTLRLNFTNPSAPADADHYILTDPTHTHSASNPYVGFLMNYDLSLKADGYQNQGSLINAAGNNAWSGPISLISANNYSVVIKVASNTQLDITGVISNQNSAKILSKKGGGNLILEPTQNAGSLPANSYGMTTLNDGSVILSQNGANGNQSTGASNLFLDDVDIDAGFITLEDSQGLGPITKIVTGGYGMTTVSSGASLHLVANVGHLDSVSNTTNKLQIYAPLTISGTGTTNEGALDSISGINVYEENPLYVYDSTGDPNKDGLPQDMITVNQGSYIGVWPDPVESGDNTYFTNDYSLTLRGLIGNSNANRDFSTWVTKVGSGHLILPTANTDFYGSWVIAQGWVTVQNEFSLGGLQPGGDSTVGLSPGGYGPDLSQGAYFDTTVKSGAALMLLPYAPNSNMSLRTNLILQGEGVTHAFPLINDMGAVENLSGVNSLIGHVTLEGQIGIGVESIYPGIQSDLTLNNTNEITQALPTALYNKPSVPSTMTIPITLAAAGVSQYSQIVDTGSTKFSGTINYKNFVGDQLQVYYGPRGTPGSHVIADTGVITAATGSLSFNDNSAIGNSTLIEIVVDGGVVPSGTKTWSYSSLTSPDTITVDSTGYFTGGLIKLGSQRLVLEGNSIFQGGVDIRQGILFVTNDTGLGQPENGGSAGKNFGTTVDAGAALVLSPTIGSLAGGVARGPSVWANHLTLNGTGNSIFGYAPLTVLADDVLWSGPITLNSALSLTFQGALAQTALPAKPVSVDFSNLTGTNPTIYSATTTEGGTNVNHIETLTFGGTVTGGTFKLTVWDGSANFTTGNITWSADPNTLIARILSALNADGNLLNAILVSLVSPTIDIFPNARLTLLGAIDDNSGPVSGDGTNSVLAGGSDLFIAGGGELTLNGANTYRGTTYVNQGTLTVGNATALGATGSVNSATVSGVTNTVNPTITTSAAHGFAVGQKVSIANVVGATGVNGTFVIASVPTSTTFTITLASAPGGYSSGGTVTPGFTQSISLTNAVAGSTYFNLAFNGIATTSPILYQGNSADAPAIQTALGNLSSVGSANVTVTQANPGVFLVTFFNAPAATGNIISPSIDPTHPLGIVPGTSISAGIEGGTEVAYNSQIQLQGSITVNNEPLVIQGQGSNLQSEVQTYTIGGDPTGTYDLTFRGATASGISYSSSAAQIQAALQNLSTVGAAGGQVTVVQTAAGGGLTDQQEIDVTSNTNQDDRTFRLRFGPTATDPNIYTTPDITFDPNSYINTEVRISLALDSLPNIGLAGAHANVGGSFLSSGGEKFTVTLVGALGDVSGLPDIQVTSGTSNSIANTVHVSHLRYGALPTKAYRVVFLGSFAGAAVPTLTAPTTSGGTTINPPSSLVSGGSANATPDQWFSNFQGTGLNYGATSPSTSIQGAKVYNGSSSVTENMSGPVTDVVVDPTDPDTIYVATAGGGAWRTQDGGLSWVPLFDQQFALANPAVMFGGKIAIDPNLDSNIYYGTGEFANSKDSYYGSGVYHSTNYGQTWSLLTDPDIGNPFEGMAISAIITNPEQDGSVVVAANDNRNFGDINGVQNSNSGVWFYEQGQWTAVLSSGGINKNGDLDSTSFDVQIHSSTSALSVGMTVTEPANGFLPAGTTVTAIDNTTRIITLSNMPTGDGTYQLRFANNPLSNFNNDRFTALYFDPGSNTSINSNDATAGAMFVAVSSNNTTSDPGVYRTPTGSGSNDFFNPASGGWNWSVANSFSPPSSGGYINLAGNTLEASGRQDTNSSGSSYYASVISGATGTGISNVYRLNPSSNWSATTNPGGLGNQGFYANAITAYGTYVFIGGTDSNNGTSFLMMSTNSGSSWTDIVNGNSNGPSTGVRAMQAYNLSGGSTPTAVDVATDGGVWRYTISGGTWKDITGNLANSQFLSASTSATNPNIALAAGHSVGITHYTTNADGTQKWIQTAGGGVSGGGTAGGDSLGAQVAYDPANPALAFYIENGNLFKSTTANTATPTWSSSVANAAIFALDPNNAQRIVIGNGTTLSESLSQGASGTFNSLSGGTNDPGMTITGLAIAQFQGQYLADPGFSNVVANPSNTIDSSTYYITNGTNISVTKNHGVSWANNREPTAANGAIDIGGANNNLAIFKIAVDPSNRDTIYAITTGTYGAAGKGHVLKSTNAGQNWTDITGGTGGLDDRSIWAIAIDPRTNDIYVGTDTGVFKLSGGVLTGANNWARFGAGLPFVQVRDIELNMSANVLTIATYGRGMYQYYLDDTQAGAGALRALSGSDTWTGPITLVGPTTIGANGSQALQNGFSGATLTLVGTISDATPTANNTITKIGGGDLALAGANTFAGLLHVTAGNLIIQNPNALGSAGTAGTQVLTLQNAIPNITQFQLSYPGAAGPTATISYTGDGATDALAIQNAISVNGGGGFLPAGGTVVSVTADPTDTMFTIVLGGTLAASIQPLFTVAVTQSTGAGFSAEAGSTYLDSGAAIQLQSSLLLEPLTLNGNGIEPPKNGHQTGSLWNLSSNHIYTGTLTLNTNTTIGVAAGTLTISPAITTSSATFVIPAVASTVSITVASASGINVGQSVYITDGTHTIAAAVTAVSGTTVTISATSIMAGNAGDTMASGASVSVDGIMDGGAGYSVTKEGAGTLVLATANSYLGDTNVTTGVLELENNAALGSSVRTIVADGAQLELQQAPGAATGLSMPANNTLYLSGTGIGTTVATVGALRNAGGNNTWAGNIHLISLPNFSSATSPAGVVAFYVDPTDSLTLSGTIDEALPPTPNAGQAARGIAPATGIAQVGTGTLVLAPPAGNSYSGGTYVGYTFGNVNISGASPAGIPGGTLAVQNQNALGTNLNNNEIQRLATSDPPGAGSGFSLTFNGQTTSGQTFGVSASTIQEALNGLTSVGLAVTGNIMAGSPVISNLVGVPSIGQLVVGMPVTGANLTGATSITASSWSANVATITAANAFAAGQTVVISGMTPAAYNGTFTIVSANAASFTVALPLAASPGAGTAFGAATDPDCYTIASVQSLTQVTLNTGIGITPTASNTALQLGGVIVTSATDYNGLSEVQTLTLTSPTSSLNRPTTLTAAAVDLAGANLNPSMIVMGTASSGSAQINNLVFPTRVQTGTTTSGSNNVIDLTDTSSFFVGEPVTASSGIPNGTTIASIDSLTSISLSANATSSATHTLTFYESHLYVGEPVSGTGIAAGTTIKSIDRATRVTLSANAGAGAGTNPLTFTQTYYYEVSAVTPLGESAANTNGQQTVATVQTVSGDTTSGSTQIQNLTSTAALLPGMQVNGAGIPRGVTILSVDSSTQVTITGGTGATVTATGVSFTFSAATVVVTGDTTTASAQITNLDTTASLAVGMAISGAGIPAGATVVSVDSATQITISANASASATNQTITFTPASPDLATTLSWTAVAGATNYRIYRSLVPNVFAQGKLATVSGNTTTYNDVGPVSLARPVVAATLDPTPGGTLLAGTAYYYEVTAVGVAGETLAGLEVSPTIVLSGDTNSTISVTNLTSTAGLNVGMTVSGAGIPSGTTIATIASATSITLSQAATATASGVSVTFLQTPIGAVAQTGNTHASTTVDNLADTSVLNPGMAVTGSGIPAGTTIASITGPNSITLSQAAATSVTGNSLSFGGQQTIDLSWTPIPRAVSYNVYRSTASGSFTNARIANVTASSYQDTGAATTSFSVPTDAFAPPVLLNATLAAGGALAPSTKYYYAVSATGPNGESSINAYQSVTTSSAAVGNLKVNLTWTAENQATGYRIYRSTTPITQAHLSNFLIATIGSGTTASYNDNGATFTLQGTTTSGNKVVTNLEDTSQVAPGMPVIGANIASGSFVVSVDSATQITLNKNATADGTGTLTFNGNTGGATQPTQTTFSLSFNLTLGNNATTNNSTDITVAAATAALLSPNMTVSGPGIQAHTTIQSIVGTTVTLSQTVTATAAAATLTFGSPAISYTGNGATDAAAIQSALEALPTIGAGNVKVTADSSDRVYTIAFQGTLSNALQNLIGASVLQSTSGASVTETTPGDGGASVIYTVNFLGGAALAPKTAQPLISINRTFLNSPLTSGASEVATGGFGTLVYTNSTLALDGDPSNVGATLAMPANAIVALNGTGVGNAGALLNKSGNNTWPGTIILQSSSNIGAVADTQLTITGTIVDPALPTATPVPTSSPANVTKVGAGAVILDPTAAAGNTYTGSTNVNAGVLNIQTAHALGYNTSAVQDIHVTGSGGSFKLSFNSAQLTSSISVGAAARGAAPGSPAVAGSVEYALNQLSNITVGGGSVFVTQSGNDYFVYFNNPLGAAGSDPLGYVAQNLLGYQTSGNASVSISTLLAGGASTTAVAAGGSGPATLQMQNAASNGGNSGSLVEASGKSLVLNGAGFNGDGALENVFGANTWASNVTLGANSTIGVDDTSNLNLSRQISDAGGGFGVTKVGTGTLQYTGDNSTSNTYTGLTNVQLGTLQLSKTGNGTAVAGNLSVGSATYLQESQTLAFSNFSSGQKYQLVFAGQSTGLITYGGGVSGDASNIATALNSLAFVTANFTSGSTPFAVALTGADTFTVTVAGVLNGTTWPKILGFRDPATTAANAAIATTLGTTSPAPAGARNSVLAENLSSSLNEIASTATVTVSDDGQFRLNSSAQQTIAGLSMTSGDVNLRSGSTLTLSGSAAVNASSDLATGTALIRGAGTLALGSLGHTFTVNHGTGATVPTDLKISTLITGSDGALSTALTKAGNGRLELSAANTYTGLTNISSGDLQVDSVNTQTITITGATAGSTSFNLIYTQGTNTGTTSAINYSATAATTASAIAGALNALLTASPFNFAGTPVSVTPLSTTVFTVAFTAQAGLNAMPLAVQSPITGSGTVSVSVVSNIGDVTMSGGSLSGTGVVGIVPPPTNTALTGPASAPGAVVNPGANGAATFTTTTVTGDTTTASAVVANLSSTAALLPGMQVTGSGIPLGTTVVSVDSATQVTLSNNATATASGVSLKFTPDIGILQTNGDVVWTSNTTFYVDLGNSGGAHPTPGAGTDYDQLYVNGNINLGSGNTGALLSGAAAANVAIGDTFTIIQATGTVTGNFTEMVGGTQIGIGVGSGFFTDAVFLSGRKFYVTYNQHSVVLTRALILDTVIVTPLANPIYGQNVTYTATVVPELGAPIPDTATNDATAAVTFTDTNTGQTFTTSVSNGTATFAPQTESASTPAGSLWATGSLHTITATFSDSLVLSQNEGYAAALTGSTTSGSADVTVSSTTPLFVGMNVTGPGIPAGATIVSINSGLSQITLSANATATLTNTALNFGPEYALTGNTTSASNSVTGLLSTTDLAIGMSVSGAGIPAGASIASIVNGTSITLNVNATATSSSISLTFGPVWAVLLAGDTTSGSASIANLPSTNQLVAGMAVSGAGIPASTFIASVNDATSITLTNNATATASSVALTFAQVVQKQNVSFSSVNYGSLTPIYGQPDTVTVTVAPAVTLDVPGAAQPIASQITLTVDGTPISAASAVGQTATFNLPTTLNVSAGPGNPHPVVVAYSTGDTNYNAATLPATNVNVQADRTTIAITPSPSIVGVGQAVTFGIQVSPFTQPSFGNPAEGTVNVYDGDPTGPSTLLNPAKATSALFAIPSVGNSVAVSFAATTWITNGQYLNISDGTNTIIALVTNVASGSVTVQTTAILAGSGPNMASGATVKLATNPASGAASFTTSSLAFGTHNVYVVFTDTDGNYIGGTANDNFVSYTIQANTAITAFTASPTAGGGDVFGQTVTFTATVNSPTLGAPPTAGRVDFYDGAVTTTASANYLGSGTVSQAAATLGQATLSTNVLTVGAHTISAVYNDVSPDQNYATSPTVTLNNATNNYIVSKANSRVVVTASGSNVQSYGNALTFTATVTAAAPGADANPTGTVTFSDSLAGNLGAGTFVSPNMWTFTTSATQFVAGTHTISATYSGDGNLTGVNATGPNPGSLASYVIAASSTAVSTPTSTTNPSVYGQPTTLSATVTGTGSGTPGDPLTGTVTFKDGATVLGTVDLGLLGSNVATLTTNPPVPQMNASATAHSITATYTPPTAATQTGTTHTSTSVTGLTNTSNLKVGMYVAGAGIPGGTTIATIVNNTSITLSQSATASATVTLSFGGNFATNVSSALSQTVSTASTVFQPITSAPGNPSGIGQSVTYTATVVTVSPSNGLGVTAGTVTFFDNSSQIGSAVTVNSSGVATVSVTYSTAAQAGSHVITAQYNPPTVAPINYTGCSTTGSTQLTQLVLKAVTVSASAVTDSWGQPMTYNVTVSSPQGGTPTGSITVTENNVAVSGVIGGTLSGGATTITIPAGTLNAGTHSLVFNYTDPTPTPVYANGTKTISQVVSTAGTQVTFTSVQPGNTAVYGSTVSYAGNVKATVTPIVTLSGQTNSNTSVTGLSSTSSLTLGMAVTGAGIQAGTTIAAITSNSTITLSLAATATANVSLQFGDFDPIAGTVNLYIDSNPTYTTLLASVTLSGTNTFSFTNISLPLTKDVSARVGNHPIFATFVPANTNFATTTRSAPDLNITQAATQISQPTSSATSSALGGSFWGQSVTFSVNVTTSISGSPVNGGAVNFYLFRPATNDYVMIGSSTVVNGAASVTTGPASFLVNTGDNVAGSNTGNRITAVYFPASSTSNFGQSGNSTPWYQKVSPAVIQVSLASTVNSGGTYGQSVQFRATISFSSTHTGQTTNGSASVTGLDSTSQLVQGMTVTGNGIPTGTVIASVVNSTSITLSQAATATSSTASLTFASPGSPATADSNAGANPLGGPFGSVDFYDGATLLGTSDGSNGGAISYVLAPNANPNVVYGWTCSPALGNALSVGNHTISAVYRNYLYYPQYNLIRTVSDYTTNVTATLSPNPYVVNQATTRTVLTSSRQYWAIGQPVTFTATVSPSSTGAGNPAGTVTFVDTVTNTTLASNVPVNTSTGVASTSVTFGGSTPPANNHAVQATFTPSNSNFSGSSDQTATQNVRKDSAVTFTYNSTNTNVTFTASVTTTSTGGPPTGTVDFYQYNAQTGQYDIFLGSGTLSNGTASYVNTSLTTGTYYIKAFYEGDTLFDPAWSPFVTVQIARRLQ